MSTNLMTLTVQVTSPEKEERKEEPVRLTLSGYADTRAFFAACETYFPETDKEDLVFILDDVFTENLKKALFQIDLVKVAHSTAECRESYQRAFYIWSKHRELPHDSIADLHTYFQHQYIGFFPNKHDLAHHFLEEYCEKMPVCILPCIDMDKLENLLFALEYIELEDGYVFKR